MNKGTFSDQYEMALTAIEQGFYAVRNLVTRAESIADLRRKEGRALSKENRNRLSTLQNTLQELVIAIDKLQDATALDRADIDEESEKRIEAMVDRLAKK